MERAARQVPHRIGHGERKLCARDAAADHRHPSGRGVLMAAFQVLGPSARKPAERLGRHAMRSKTGEVRHIRRDANV